MREYNNPLIIGECAVPPEEIWKFVSPNRKELDMIIDFDFVNLGIDFSKGYGKYALKEWGVEDLRKIVNDWIIYTKDGTIAQHM